MYPPQTSALKPESFICAMLLFHLKTQTPLRRSLFPSLSVSFPLPFSALPYLLAMGVVSFQGKAKSPRKAFWLLSPLFLALRMYLTSMSLDLWHLVVENTHALIHTMTSFSISAIIVGHQEFRYFHFDRKQMLQNVLGLYSYTDSLNPFLFLLKHLKHLIDNSHPLVF